MTVIGRYDRPDGRYYVDPLDPDSAYLSVTSVLGATTAKEWLGPWYGKLAAQYAVDHLADLIAQVERDGADAAVHAIKDAARRARDLKADVGTYGHNVIEALILDGNVPGIPDHLDGQLAEWDGEVVKIDQAWLDSIITGFLTFVDDFDVEFELAEATVVHPAHGWAGTLDAIGVLKRLRRAMRLLIDAKFGLHLDPTMNEQCSAYPRATEVWLDMLGNRCPMPPTDRAAILHIRPSYEAGYKLLEVPADNAAYGRFLQRLAIVRGTKEQPRITGRPLYPAIDDAGTQPAPLIEDVDHPGFNPYRRPLIAAGLRRLDEVAAFTVEDLLAVKGIGKKAPDHVRAALAKHGLVLAGDVAPVLAGVA